MTRLLQLCFFFGALFCQSLVTAQSTWQKTYPGLNAATAVLPDFEEGYIIGGTLSNGNGVLIKVSEEGSEVWRIEIPGRNGVFIQNLRGSAQERCYYFIAIEGCADYLSKDPLYYYPNWELPVSGMLGKVSETHEVIWIKTNLMVKGEKSTAPMDVLLTNNYLLVSGYTYNKKDLDGFLQTYRRNDGALVKEKKIDRYVRDLFTNGNLVMTLSLTRNKKFHSLKVDTYDEELKQLVEKTSKLNIFALAGYPMLLLPFNKEKYASALLHYLGGQGVERVCLPIFANNETSENGFQLSLSTYCGGRAVFANHSLDIDRNFILVGSCWGKVQTAPTYMLWAKISNDYRQGPSQVYNYAQINNADKTKYPDTIGFDVAPTRDGGSIMVGFATSIKDESPPKYKDRIGWVLKVNEKGTW